MSREEALVSLTNVHFELPVESLGCRSTDRQAAD